MNHLKSWLPSRGNVLFTLVIAASLIFYVHSVGAFPGVNQPKAPEVITSTGTIAYQGRLFSASGVPLNSSYPMTFTFYNVSTGGSALWTEARPSVAVSDGLFNVLLGSATPITQSVITGNSSLWLGVQIGADPEMTPRVQLGSAPFAMQSLVVPTGAITTSMIADGAVTSPKLKPTLDVINFMTDQIITTTTPWTAVLVPQTSFTVTVAYPARMAVWYFSTVRTVQPGTRDLILLIDSNEAFVSTIASTSEFYNFSGATVWDLPPGAHNIKLVIQSSNPDESLLFLGNRTSVLYQIISR